MTLFLRQLKRTVLITTLKSTLPPAKICSFLVMVNVRVGDGDKFSYKIYGCEGSFSNLFAKVT